MGNNNKVVASLGIRLTTDLMEFQKGMKKAAKQFKRMSRQIQKVGKTLTTHLTLPIVAAGTAMLYTSNKAADYADKIDKAAIKTGLTRESLQELSYVADQAGVDFASIEGAVQRLTKAMGDAEYGSIRQIEAFKKLGVNIKDSSGNMKEMKEIFPEIIGELSSMQNETERNALAMELFGRSAMNIVPHLSVLGKEGMQQLIEKAHKMGLVMKDDAIAGLVAYKDNLSTLKQQFQALSREIAEGFVPIMQDFIIPLIRDNIIPIVKKWAKQWNSLSESTKTIALKLAAIVSIVGPLLTIFGKLTKMFGSLIAFFGKLKLAAIGTCAAAADLALIAKVLYDSWSPIKYFFMKLWLDIERSFVKVALVIINVFDNILKHVGISLSGARSSIESTLADIEGEINKYESKNSNFGSAISNNIIKSLKEAKKYVLDLFNTAKDGPSVSSESGALGSGTQPIKITKDTPVSAINGNDSGINVPKNWKPKKESDWLSGKSPIENNLEMGGLADMSGMVERMKKFRDSINKITIDMKSAFAGLASSIASSWGDSIEAIASGQASIGDLFKNILIAVLDFAKQFGEQLVAAGTATLAFKSLLLSPGAAIAAGMALITAASALKGMLAKGPKAPALATGGLAYGPTMAMVGDNPRAHIDPEVISPLSKLKALMPQANMPGEVRLRAEGGDLVGIFNVFNRKNNSMR